jgi:NAD(P)-dependent dehydrogenase (short-subunit alcohol dehydrogenase family)
LSAPGLTSFPEGGTAAVFGASGGLGAALTEAVRASGRFASVVGFSRGGAPGFDLTDEASIQAATARLAEGPPLRLAILAAGVLHGPGFRPEKSWRDLDASALRTVFEVNALGPALLMKHVLPLLAADGRSAFVALSARVGSIGDNEAGGWYAYRASKAALNQMVRTAAIELRRRRPQALCVSLHPGTVDTALSKPFAKTGLSVRPPETAAADLLEVVDRLQPDQSGGFFDYAGQAIPW